MLLFLWFFTETYNKTGPEWVVWAWMAFLLVNILLSLVVTYLSHLKGLSAFLFFFVGFAAVFAVPAILLLLDPDWETRRALALVKKREVVGRRAAMQAWADRYLASESDRRAPPKGTAPERPMRPQLQPGRRPPPASFTRPPWQRPRDQARNPKTT